GDSGPAGEVDGYLGQRFLHRQHEKAVSADAALIAHRLHDRFAEADAHILDGVVIVHVQIPASGNAQVEEAVAPDVVEHVVEEANARLYLYAAAAIQVEIELGLRLLRAAAHARAAGRVAAGQGQSLGCGLFQFDNTSRRAAINASFCSGVPTVMRRE